MSRKRMLDISCIGVLIVILFLMPTISKSPYWISVLAVAGINVLLVSSLRTISLIDHMSLGHVGFALIGAYGSALLVMNLGLSFWIALVLGGIMAGIFALVLGYPFLKVRGMYFAVLTLLTAETLRSIAYYWTHFTGGAWGLSGIPAPKPVTLPAIGILRFNTVHHYYYIIASVVLLSLVAIYKLERSHLGFGWRAIRDADNLAESVGINTAWYKMLNFAIACFFAGVAGSLFAHYQHNLSVDQTSRFGVFTSIYLLVYLAVGGATTFAGPIVGTFVMMLVAELFRPLGEYQAIAIAAITIIVVLFMPKGLVGLLAVPIAWFHSALLKPTEQSKGQG